MKVTTQPKGPGTHRFEYDFRWYMWALPFAVGMGTSYYPTADSGMDLDRWQVQRVLLIDVLCFRMRVVVQGPLFDDLNNETEDEDDELHLTGLHDEDQR